MTKREELIQLIDTGDEFNLFEADIRTFHWLRTNASRLFLRAAASNGIGGGNFAIALISLSRLDLLGQVYNILRDNIPSSGWDVINHTNCFKKIVKDSLTWGFNDTDLDTIWNSYRNYLTHMHFPKYPIKVFKEGLAKSIKVFYKKLEESDKPAFKINNSKDIVCNSDILFRDVKRTKLWMTEQLKAGKFSEDAIVNALGFIRK